MWSENTTSISIEKTRDSTMVEGLMIYIIQNYQYEFSSRFNAFNQSICREMIFYKPDGKNTTNVKQHRLKRSK